MNTNGYKKLSESSALSTSVVRELAAADNAMRERTARLFIGNITAILLLVLSAGLLWRSTFDYDHYGIQICEWIGCGCCFARGLEILRKVW